MAVIPEVTLGTRVRLARQAAKMEQAELAEAIGVSRATVSLWERDVSEPRVSQIQRLADVTDVDLTWLLAGVARNASLLDSLEAAEAIAPVQEPLPGLLSASSFAA